MTCISIYSSAMSISLVLTCVAIAGPGGGPGDPGDSDQDGSNQGGNDPSVPCWEILESGSIASGRVGMAWGQFIWTSEETNIPDYWTDDFYFSSATGPWQGNLLQDHYVWGWMHLVDGSGFEWSRNYSRAGVDVITDGIILDSEAETSAEVLSAPLFYNGDAKAESLTDVYFEVNGTIELSVSMITFGFDNWGSHDWIRELTRVEYTSGGDFSGWHSVETIIRDRSLQYWTGWTPHSYYEGNLANRNVTVVLEPGVYRFLNKVKTSSGFDDTSQNEEEFYAGSTFSNMQSTCNLEFECVGSDSYSDADFNRDGNVDGSDLARILSAWGSSSPALDLDGDGMVNGADLSILLGEWN